MPFLEIRYHQGQHAEVRKLRQSGAVGVADACRVADGDCLPEHIEVITHPYQYDEGQPHRIGVIVEVTESPARLAKWDQIHAALIGWVQRTIPGCKFYVSLRPLPQGHRFAEYDGEGITKVRITAHDQETAEANSTI